MINYQSNGRTVINLLVNQIVLIFFSFILGMVTVKHSALYACVSVFCILFYFFLLYTMCWEIGAKDKLRVEGGRMDPAPFKCVWLALAANAVNLLSALTACISKLFLPFAEDMSLWQRLSSPAVHPDSATAEAAETAIEGLLAADCPVWLHSLYSISEAITRILLYMFRGLEKLIAPENPLIHLASIGATVLVCGMAYYLGSKNFRFLGALSGKPSQNQ